MSQSVVRTANVKWDISVPSEFDEEIRFYLASQLVQKAVSRYILSSLSRKAKDKVENSGLSQKDLEKIISDSLTWATD